MHSIIFSVAGGRRPIDLRKRKKIVDRKGRRRPRRIPNYHNLSASMSRRVVAWIFFYKITQISSNSFAFEFVLLIICWTCSSRMERLPIIPMYTKNIPHTFMQATNVVSLVSIRFVIPSLVAWLILIKFFVYTFLLSNTKVFLFQFYFIYI